MKHRLPSLRSTFLALTLLATLTALAGAAAEPQTATRPNILLICIDDLKPLLGCYGSPLVKSPNIDRLASRGVRFEHAFCNQAVCAPSRNSLMTGLRPTTLGIYDLATNFRQAAPNSVTLAQYFMNHGYRTEAMGKIFHVGHGNHEDPASWSVPHWSPRLSGLGGGYVLKENRPPTLTREEALFSNAKVEISKLPRGAAIECADVPDDSYADGQIATEAIGRLKAAAKLPGTPFFIAVGFHKPHLPFVAPKKYWDLYSRAEFQPPTIQRPPKGAPAFAPTTWGELRQYSDIPETGPLTPELERLLIHGYHASVSYMDAQLGRVIAELDSLDLAKNTVIVLWGDNGWHLGDHGMWSKHTNYEQAAHIPLIVCAPGVSQAGAKVTALVETVDIYPTLCELAGLPVPKDLDGASFTSVLKNPSTGRTKEAIFHVFPRSPRGLGELIGRAVRTERYRLVEWKKASAPPQSAILELYDYEKDPDETVNLAESLPEIVAQLRKLLAAQPEARPQLRVRPPTANSGAAKKQDATARLAQPSNNQDSK